MNRMVGVALSSLLVLGLAVFGTSEALDLRAGAAGPATTTRCRRRSP